MTTTEFECYVRKGLGRAVTLLQNESDKTPFYETIMRIIERQPGYTHISAQYLYELIRASDSYELENAAVERSDDLINMPYSNKISENNLLALFYKDGNKIASEKLEQMYRILYSELSVHNENLDIMQDKINAFMFLSLYISHATDAERLREILLDIGSLFDVLDGMFDNVYFYNFYINAHFSLKKTFDSTLSTLCEELPQSGIARFAVCINEISRKKQMTNENRPPQQFDIDQLIDNLFAYVKNSDGRIPHEYYEHLNELTPEHLNQLAQLTVGETDLNVLNRVFWLFTNDAKPWPLDPLPLIDLVRKYMDYLKYNTYDTPEKRLSNTLIYVLSYIPSEPVRTLALELIERGFLSQGVALWAKNYRTGDSENFIKAFKPTCLVEDGKYSRTPYYEVLELIEHNGDEALIELIEYILEHTYNSHMRYWAVKMLHSHGLLTDTIIEECRHDNDYEVREYIDYLTKGAQH